MRLTLFTDYGLRMLMVMAREPDRLFSTQDLADNLQLSRNHLQKIIQRLAENGIIHTQRGVSGGVRLAKSPDQLHLGTLVECLERDQSLVECLGDKPCSCIIEKGCRLKARLKRAERRFLDDLNESTLGDIALTQNFRFTPAA